MPVPPQPGPPDDRVPLAALMREGFRWFLDRLQAEGAQAGRPQLTTAQATLMACLRPADVADGVTVSELARRLGVSRQVAHVTVHELVTAGILDVTPDPRSGRRKLVRTTPAGEDRRQQAWRTLHDLEDEIAARIGPDLLDALRAGLTAAWPPS